MKAENDNVKRQENAFKDISLDEPINSLVFNFGRQRLHDSRGPGWEDKAAKISGKLANVYTTWHELKVYFALYVQGCTISLSLFPGRRTISC